MVTCTFTQAMSYPTFYSSIARVYCLVELH